MLLDGVIPSGLKVRRTFHFWPGEKGFVNRAYRNVINRIVKSRFSGTDYFFALVQSLDFARMEKRYKAEGARLKLRERLGDEISGGRG